MPDGVFVVLPPKPNWICELGIGGLAVLVALVWLGQMSLGKPHRAKWLGLGVISWFAANGTAATSGWLTRLDVMPPPMALMIAGVIAISVLIGFSPLGKFAAGNLSFAALVGLQAFRLPLELIMHHAATEGIMPVQLSYSGYNLDILTGLSAAVISAALALNWRVSSRLLWCWNILGRGLLADDLIDCHYNVAHGTFIR